MGEEILQLNNISKTFPGVKALSEISFSLMTGEIHCICGENGAGKSTLIKIISGAYQPDEGGQIIFEGKAVKLDPYSAMQLGIQTIYQEHTIFPHLSITENIFVGLEITKRRFIMQKDQMYRKTKEVLEFLHSDLDPSQLVDDLSSGEQKIVEIAKALVFDRKVIILDEPTSSFSANEIDHLLSILKKITERGIGIIYISHHLEEVFKIADIVTVLRDGKKVKTCGIVEIDEPQLIRDMVGRDASAFYSREHFTPGEVVLEAKKLSGNGVNGISFTARRGEIVGFAGMVGSGRSELMTLLFGGAEKMGGEVYVMGRKVDYKSPTDAIRNKMCFITEDRQNTGLFLKHSIARNTIIANMVNTKGRYIRPKDELKVGDRYMRQLKTKAEDSTILAMNLSGGNQQKVVLAKWFYTDGEIYFFDEPTRGIDVGSKQEIYQTMMELLKQGKSIVMASSDMPEVVSMSDRVYVMKNGKISGELSREEVSEQNVLKFSIGGSKL
jgi:ribose transport system ATP-binding protein